MGHYEKLGSPSELKSDVKVHLRSVPVPSKTSCKDTKCTYADNLAFDDDELLTRNAIDVYRPLTEQKDYPQTGPVYITISAPPKNKKLLLQAISIGCFLASLIILLYFWVHIRYISPMIIETFRANSTPPISPSSRGIFLTDFNTKITKIDKLPEPEVNHKSTWLVEYDVPVGVPVLTLNAKDIEDLTEISCPTQKVALALHLEWDSYLAENWLKVCGSNVAYFRVDGDCSPEDVDRMLEHLQDARYLPLKAALSIGKGENILDNEEFQKTRKSDDIIRSVEISGWATPQTIEELIEAVPYAEELTIVGDSICKSLQRSRSSQESCKMSWDVLQKLHFVETGDCRGMFDLIYSCWNMPSIEIVQVRRSNINDANANFIAGIIDKYRITRVDFADNVCFGNTLEDYPYMCQPSN